MLEDAPAAVNALDVASAFRRTVAESG